MARLSASDRASLSESAFAYVDSRGRRRLPIHDESHVRNALARFDQVRFEDDAARDRALKRLLNAAKKYGIVPVGFITGQLRSAQAARPSDEGPLPAGFVTLLLTDIEGSTALLRQLGDRYPAVLSDVRSIIRRAVLQVGGREVEARADEFFAVFERVEGGLEAALTIQRSLQERAWPDDVEVRVRAAIHSGPTTLTDTGYVGLSIHTAARVCSVAHGGQIVVTGETRAAIEAPTGVAFRSLGRHRLPGLMHAQALFQVEADGLLSDFPPLRMGVTSSAAPGP